MYRWVSSHQYACPCDLWGLLYLCSECYKLHKQWQSRGWSGGAKVLCILHYRGVQLILAYSWARPAILVVGKGRGGMFLFLLFLHFHSCSSFFPVPLFHLLFVSLQNHVSSPFWRKWPSWVDASLNLNSSSSSSFISSTLSSISFLPFSGRRHKMTLKGWHVVKPQHNQSMAVNWRQLWHCRSAFVQIPSGSHNHTWDLGTSRALHLHK